MENFLFWSHNLKMAKSGDYRGARKGSRGILRSIIGKLQTGFSVFKGVKQGYFVVVATEGWKPERFVIDLGYLNNPEFLKLLKQAEEDLAFPRRELLQFLVDQMNCTESLERENCERE